MFDNDVRLQELLVRRKGLLVRREAYAAQIPRHVLDDRVAAGVLIVVHEGVLRHAAVPVTQDQRWLAAVLAAGSDAVLSHRAAAALHGWPGVQRSRPEVTSPHTDLPLLRGVDVHRALRLRPFERTVVRGIPVTSRGKTALDLCAVSRQDVAQEVIAEVVIMKLLSPMDIVTTLERSTGRGVRGSAMLRAIGRTLDELDGLESVLELRGARELELARVPSPMRQHEMICADGRAVRMDLAWPDIRLGLDWDGKRWHGTPARRKRTRERHASIEASGWRHLAFGWADVHDTPADMRREVELEHQRRRDLAA